MLEAIPIKETRWGPVNAIALEALLESYWAFHFRHYVHLLEKRNCQQALIEDCLDLYAMAKNLINDYPCDTLKTTETIWQLAKRLRTEVPPDSLTGEWIDLFAPIENLEPRSLPSLFSWRTL